MISEGKGRFWVVASVMLMIALIGLTVLFVSDHKKQVRVDQKQAEQIAKYRETLAKCEDAKQCIGGFISNDGRIKRIDLCSQDCTLRAIVDLIDLRAYGQYTKGARIVLPNDPTWPTMAVEYARQFVQTK